MTDLLGNRDIQPNPFTPDFGKHPQFHVGRDDLLRSLQEGLGIGPRDNRFTSLLLGPRGSGKTVVLSMVEDIAQNAGWIVLPLDATTAGIEDRLDEFISWAHDRHEPVPEEQYARQTVRTSAKVRLWAAEWQREAATEVLPRWGIRRRLATLAEHAARHDTAVLLTLDEMHSGERSELRRLAADIQHITKREGLPLAFTGAGLSEMNHTLLEDKKMTFFQRCARFDMPPLTSADIMHCLRETVQGAGGVFAGRALNILAEASGTLPYRMQVAGYHAWEIAGAPDHPIDDKAAAMSEQQTDLVMYNRIAIPTWHTLKSPEQTILKVVAALGGSATPEQVAAQANLSAATLARAEQHLVNIGCVVVTVDGAIQIIGLMSAEDVLRITERETRYNSPSTAQKPSSPC